MSVTRIARIAVAGVLSVISTVAAAQAPAPQAQWNGLYVGAIAGYGWGNSAQSSQVLAVAPPPPFLDGSYNVSGAALGGSLGYNLIQGQYLFGVEADYSWSNIKGSTTCGGGTECGTDIKSFGTMRGRIGFVSNDTLFFVAGGWALADVKAYDLLDPQQGTKIRSGWTIGGGIERKIQGPLSLRAEYLYADFGKADQFTNVGHTPEEIKLDTHVFRLGLNYKLETQ